MAVELLSESEPKRVQMKYKKNWKEDRIEKGKLKELRLYI